MNYFVFFHVFDESCSWGWENEGCRVSGLGTSRRGYESVGLIQGLGFGVWDLGLGAPRLKGSRVGPLEGTLNPLPQYNPYICIYRYVPYIILIYRSSPLINP